MVRTIGVAVGIPEPWGSQIDEHRAASGDPMAAYIPAHLTLLGPVEVDASPAHMAKIEDHLTAVASAHSGFALQLRGAGTFRPVTQVVFVAIATGTLECERLASDIRSGPLQGDLRFSYHPHITVAHDIDDAALDAAFAGLTDFEASFAVADFTLYEHGLDGHWRPQRRFELAP